MYIFATYFYTYMSKIKKKIVLKNCDYKAQQYCFSKGLMIYPEAINGLFKVRCDLGSKHKYYNNGQTYSIQEVYQAIWDLYREIHKNR